MADRDYKTAEQKIFEVLTENSGSKFVKDFAYTSTRTFYAWLATPLRIPTFVRKLKEGQTMLSLSYGDAEDDGTLIGAVVGSIAGIDTLASLLGFELDGMSVTKTLGYEPLRSAHEGNYAPLLIGLGIVGATNLASGMYELGRSQKSKLEVDKI